MTRRWSLRLLAGVLAGAALLSGCAEKQQANESLPSASASPTEEALPPLGPEDLPMPAEARTQDAAGAEAFVRYYIELINRTSDVMDAQPLRDFSDGCADCNRIANSVEEDAAAGYEYEGGGITITEMGQPADRARTTAELALRGGHRSASGCSQADGTARRGRVPRRSRMLSGGASSLSGARTRIRGVMPDLTLG